MIKSENEGHTTMIVKADEEFVVIIMLMDVARKDAKETLAQLQKKGIRKW